MSIGWVWQPQTFSSLHNTFSSLVLPLSTTLILGLPCVQNHLVSVSRGAAIGNAVIPLSYIIYAVIPTHVRRRVPQNERELTMSNRKKKVALQRKKTERSLGKSFSLLANEVLYDFFSAVAHRQLSLVLRQAAANAGRYHSIFPIAAPRLTETR